MRAATNTINTIVAALTLCAGAMEGREKAEYSPTRAPARRDNRRESRFPACGDEEKRMREPPRPRKPSPVVS